MAFSKTFIQLLLLISPIFIYSQLKGGDDVSYSSNWDSKEKMFQFVSETYLSSNKVMPLKSLVQSGELYIRQVGADNNLNVNLKANFIKVELIQNGDYNNLELDKEANSIKQKILQEGTNNSIKDFAMQSNSNVNMEFLQQGNNQKIENYGSNSISENMKVIQSGNGAAVIIINTK